MKPTIEQQIKDLEKRLTFNRASTYGILIGLYKKALRAEKRKVKNLTTFSVSRDAVKFSKLDPGFVAKMFKNRGLK